MNGNNIIIGTLSGGVFTPFAAVKAHEMQTKCEAIEKASATQQDWTEVVAGRKSWSLTVNYLVLSDAGSSIEDLLHVGTVYSIASRTRDGIYEVSGSALCTAVKHTYTRGNIAQGSFSFEGSGALS